MDTQREFIIGPPAFLALGVLYIHMNGSESIESPLKAAAEATGAQTTEAFQLLGNETRLAILLALWDASDPDHEVNGLTFSELRDRVGIRQGGEFNYHLDKLVGRFVERTDKGYTLRNTGAKVVRTVIGTAGFESPSLERAEIEMPCRHCGGQTALSYEDEWLYRVCTECKGTFETSGLPDGCLTGFPLAPAAVTNRTPQEMFAVAKFQTLQSIHNKMEGICPECSGPVGKQLEVCDDHAADGICNTCGRAEPVRVRLVCHVCKDWSIVPVPTCMMFHPEVIGFYYDHGIALQWNVDDFTTMRRIHDLIVTEVDLVAEDSSRVRVTYSHDDDLCLTLDEELNIIEVHETA